MYDGRKVRVVEAKCKVMDYEGEMKNGDCGEDTVIQMSREEERIGEQKREYSIVLAHVHTHTHTCTRTYLGQETVLSKHSSRYDIDELNTGLRSDSSD
jgi:hypothetical protein